MSVRRFLSRGVRKLSSNVYFGESTSNAPVINAITTPFNLNDIFSVGNIYQMAEAIVDWDADVKGIIERISHLCKTAYNGVYIEAGQKLDPQEEDMLEFAKDIAERLDFAAEIASICMNMTKFGDVVKHMVWNVEEGIIELQNLPRAYLTAIDDKSKIGTIDAIHKANFFVLNEQGIKEEIFEAETCVHFPLNNKATTVYDLKNRATFSVWSKAPMLSLLSTMKWKLNSIINDILWTHRNVPREHHKLDLSMYTPELYSGTPQERVEQAETGAQSAAQTYHSNMQQMEADVGYVTDKNTEILYVEPKTTSYTSPNEKIAQINESISNCLGLTPVVRQQSFAAALMGGSFAVLQALSLAEIAKRGLETVLRKSLEVQYGPRFTAEDRKKVKIRLRLILEKDRSEVMRQIAIMVDANAVMPTFTPTEIRAEWGLEPMTGNQLKEFTEYLQFAKLIEGEGTGHSPSVKSVVDDEKKTIRNPSTNWPKYPSEEEKRDELQ